MPSLETVQHAMMCAIDLGPAFVREELFVGGRARALRGLKVHANTISHGRLVALEDSFPRTRVAMGEQTFNLHSRGYLDRPGVAALPLAGIGADFAEHLAEVRSPVEAVDLARFEWAWLTCYQAADATAVTIADLANLGEAGLLDLVLSRHPASALVEIGAAARSRLSDETGLVFADPAILITRPEAEVRVMPANATMRALWRAFANPTPVCNLLAMSDEPGSEDRSATGNLGALLALIGAGAFVPRRIGTASCSDFTTSW